MSTWPQMLVTKRGHKHSILEPSKKLNTFLILEIRQMISLENIEFFGVMKFISLILW